MREWLAFVEKDASTYNFGFINYACTNFDAHKFASSHCESNLASGNVMKKCGLHFVGYGKFQKLDGSVQMRSMEYEGER